ncbi:MAG: FAD/NAD(P)-binding oxidoreductase [Anaerolineales bacterium]|jgi:NADPH-dependent 2,4-dienoyl-CoA reductase/sulfur reductase-like enzyme
MKHVDLAVIGAGPAGIAAAVAGARHGLSVTLLDESPSIGGQVLNVPETELTVRGQSIRRGLELLDELQDLPVEILGQTAVWGIKGTHIAFAGVQGADQLEARSVVIATGAREYVPPFPGWTLPGVMTLGGAQHLVKRDSTLPGRSILIAGAGPLMWALAAATLEKGGRVHAILDSSRPSAWLSALPHVAAIKERIGLALHYLGTIRAHHVPYHFLGDALRAYGANELERVVIGGNSYEVDALCVGFGFRPNIELLQLAGCALKFDQSLGGWIPVTDEGLRTDQPGLLAAGECAGVGGAEKALLEGELAAFSVLAMLGHELNPSDLKREAWLRKHRGRELRFARVLNSVSEAPAAYWHELTDDTILCRCEGVRAGQVRKTIRREHETLDALKNELRVGQGACQGRTCGPILQHVLMQDLERAGHVPPPFHVRPPVKPLALGSFERQV